MYDLAACLLPHTPSSLTFSLPPSTLADSVAASLNVAGQVCCLRAFVFSKSPAWITLPPNIHMAPFLPSFRSTQV